MRLHVNKEPQIDAGRWGKCPLLGRKSSPESVGAAGEMSKYTANSPLIVRCLREGRCGNRLAIGVGEQAKTALFFTPAPVAAVRLPRGGWDGSHPRARGWFACSFRSALPDAPLQGSRPQRRIHLRKWTRLKCGEPSPSGQSRGVSPLIPSALGPIAEFEPVFLRRASPHPSDRAG